MTHNQCHQSCKGESRTQDHSHTKLGTFRSTTKALLLIWQSLAFYSNRVIAADLADSHFLWAGTFIMFFQMKFKFSKKIQTVYNFIQFFVKLDCYAFPVKACILNELQLQCSPYQKIKSLLECWKVCQTYHASKFSHFNVLNSGERRIIFLPERSSICQYPCKISAINVKKQSRARLLLTHPVLHILKIHKMYGAFWKPPFQNQPKSVRL